MPKGVVQDVVEELRVCTFSSSVVSNSLVQDIVE